MKALSRSW